MVKPVYRSQTAEVEHIEDPSSWFSGQYKLGGNLTGARFSRRFQCNHGLIFEMWNTGEDKKKGIKSEPSFDLTDMERTDG